MTGLTVTPTQILAGVGVLLVLFWVWRAGSRRAKAAARTARNRPRLVSLAGPVLVNAGLIVAVQWTVITHAGAGWLLLAVLGLPALFAAHSLTRTLMVATVDTSKRGGRR
ncbi:hypothetical protein ABZU76_49075 [Amycolatopsis sp. NPDC005232]|uniref:hypothetical protein n=1 Tax=Amycolatopsis sp. NPDC005232 TaxID=3157027 RepID=UPI0033B3E0B1